MVRRAAEAALFERVPAGVPMQRAARGVATVVAEDVEQVLLTLPGVAAVAVARSAGLPRRVVTILEGESLLNDATALVALRTAIAAIAEPSRSGRSAWTS